MRRALRIIKDRLPEGTRFRLVREEHRIKVDDMPLLKVEVQQGAPSSLLWVHETLQKLGIEGDKADMVAAFQRTQSAWDDSGVQYSL